MRDSSTKYQLLARIVQAPSDPQKVIKVVEDLFTTATSRNFLITKMTCYSSSYIEDGNKEAIIVVFETQVQPEQKFPGVFSVHRRAATETYYTLNALEAVRKELNVENDEELFESLKNTLATMHNGSIVRYQLTQVRSYVRHGNSLVAL